VIAYTITYAVLIIITCTPVDAQWMQFNLRWRARHEFSCTTRSVQTTIAKLIGALSVISDFYAVCIPVYLLFQIQISRQQKIGLYFIFGIGIL
jgi:hypothetical protein